MTKSLSLYCVRHSMASQHESVNCMNCQNSSTCFKKLIPKELEFINQNKTQVHYRQGETICKEGAFASYILYIADGLAKVYLEGARSNNINLRIARTKDFIGLSALFDEKIYNYSAIALRESSICLIEKESFTQLLNANGPFASEMIRWFCKQESQLFRKVNYLCNKQMHGRLASALLYLCQEELLCNDLFTLLTRKDIAEFSCISTESAVRILSELNNEGIIELDGKKIQILKPDKLKSISRNG